MKKIMYTLLFVSGLFNIVFYGMLSACPTCLAHLKRSDKPFFARQLSAQIAATQTIVKTIKDGGSKTENTLKTNKE